MLKCRMLIKSLNRPLCAYFMKWELHDRAFPMHYVLQEMCSPRSVKICGCENIRVGRWIPTCSRNDGIPEPSGLRFKTRPLLHSFVTRPWKHRTHSTMLPNFPRQIHRIMKNRDPKWFILAGAKILFRQGWKSRHTSNISVNMGSPLIVAYLQ